MKSERISWNEKRKRWQVEFDFNGKKSKYYFENELDAIKTRNRVYKNMGITPQDTEICEIPNQQVTHIQNKSSMTHLCFVLSHKNNIFLKEINVRKMKKYHNIKE
jgi:hypothetical protein